MEDKNLENSVKKGISHSLEIGVIQPFQVEDQLRLKGIPNFSIHRLKRDILEDYRKKHHCY